MNIRIFYAVIFTLGVLMSSCSTDTTISDCPSEDCFCSESACTCRGGFSCDWIDSEASGCSENGNSCSFQCLENSVCTGQCNESCSINCRGGSSCDFISGKSASISCEQAQCRVTVGESGSVSCGSQADCAVTCTGSCSVSCSDSTCSIQCASDTLPRVFQGSASC